MTDGDWCVVGSWYLNDSLQVYEDMGNRRGLYSKEFGDTGNWERLCEKREGRNDLGEMGEGFRACEGL